LLSSNRSAIKKEEVGYATARSFSSHLSGNAFLSGQCGSAIFSLHGPEAVTEHSAFKNGNAMHKILEKLKEEFFAVLPPTIFFFLALHLVTFIRVLITKGSHFEPLSTMSIAIASLILGKAVLIADMLLPINRYPVSRWLTISHGRR
jgi:hypothetical protein